MKRIQRFQAGQRVAKLRHPLNRMVDVLNGAEPVGDESPLTAPQELILVEVRLLNADTLTCNDVGDQLTPNARLYNVTLPWTLHPASLHGINYVYSDINNRVADATETQILTPVYNVLDQLWVKWIQDGDGSYVDANFDGRQWAAVP